MDMSLSPKLQKIVIFYSIRQIIQEKEFAENNSKSLAELKSDDIIAEKLNLDSLDLIDLVMALEDIFIPEPIIGTIASFAPGMTFNIIEKNKFRKIKVDAPNMTSGIGKCPNENCITNHDGEASPKFIHT